LHYQLPRINTSSVIKIILGKNPNSAILREIMYLYVKKKKIIISIISILYILRYYGYL